MKDSLNIPYVKQYSAETGKVVNPIVGEYKTEGDNRRARRNADRNTPFFGNSKNFHLTVTERGKYLRRKQFIHTAQGGTVVIEHYDVRDRLCTRDFKN